MDNNILTLIIPVYNTPAFALERLVNSLITQKDNNFSIIFVNDGSNEETKDKLEKIAASIKNASVINKANGGVSSARNEGIRNAKTEYISFVDADDTLKEDYVSSLCDAIKQYSPDVVYASIMKNPIEDTPKQSDGRVEVFIGKQKIELIKEALLGVENRKLTYFVLGTPCARAYKSEVAQKVLFRENIHFYEDQLFNREYLEYVNSAVIIPNVIYTYEQNDYSAMHKNRNINFYEKTLPYLRTFYEFNQRENERYKKSLRKEQILFLYAIINYDFIYNPNSDYENYKKNINAIIEEAVFKDSISNLKLSISEDGLMECINFFFIKRKWLFALYIDKYLVYYCKKVKKIK